MVCDFFKFLVFLYYLFVWHRFLLYAHYIGRTGDGSVVKINLSKETVAHNEEGMLCGFVSNPCCTIKEVIG